MAKEKRENEIEKIGLAIDCVIGVMFDKKKKKKNSNWTRRQIYLSVFTFMKLPICRFRRCKNSNTKESRSKENYKWHNDECTIRKKKTNWYRKTRELFARELNCAFQYYRKIHEIPMKKQYDRDVQFIVKRNNVKTWRKMLLNS